MKSLHFFVTLCDQNLMSMK